MKPTYFSKETPGFLFKTAIPLLLSAMPSLAYSTNSQGIYYIQIASYKTRQLAQADLERAKQQTHFMGRIRTSHIQDELYYQVQLGPYPKLKAAMKAKQKLGKKQSGSFILSYEESKTKQQATTKIIPAIPNIHKKFRPVNHDMTLKTIGMPYHSRGIANGTLAQRTNFFDGDILFPVIGNNDWIAYIDGAGKYGDDEAWLGSGGLGYRGILGEQLLGSYVFLDANTSINNNLFWILNPGVEIMNTTWDAHLNGYIPASSRQQFLGQFSGTELGMNTTFFRNHTQYDSVFRSLEAIGPGLDGEVGYTWGRLYNARSYVGGYHFNVSEGPNINGIEGGIEVPINQFASVIVHDAYDKIQKNTAMLSLRLTFGAIPKNKPITDVRERMLDPLRRHLGSLQTGAGIPIIKETKDVGLQVLLDNIWFFTPNASAFDPLAGFGNCTFEHPCGSLNQTAISGINSLASNANFYINSGTYDSVVGGLSLFNGQKFYGRQAHFAAAAQGANRPLINNSLFLNGNNTVDSVQITANTVAPAVGSLGASLAGVQVNADAAGPILINNVLINASADSVLYDVDGIRIVANANPSTVTTVSNTTINTSISSSFNQYVRGIVNASDNTLIVKDSEITANTLNGSGNLGQGGSIAIKNFSNASAVISNSRLIGNSIGSYDAEGLQSDGNGNVVVYNSTIIANVTGGLAGTRSLAVTAFPGNITLNNSTILATQNNSATYNAFAIFNDGGLINLNNSSATVSINSNVGNSTGIYNDNNGVTNSILSQISASAPLGATVEAIVNVNGGAFNSDVGTQCFENGVLVPC